MRHLSARYAVLFAFCGLLCENDVVRAAPPGSRALGRGSRGYCLQLFGDARARQASAAYRRKYLRSIKEQPAYITIIHTHPGWQEPSALGVEGIEFEDSAHGSGAIVRIDEWLARKVGCAPGRFIVTAGDSLGKATQILAVVRRVLLVEHRTKLRYIAARGAPPPSWLCAWSGRAPRLERRGGR